MCSVLLAILLYGCSLSSKEDAALKNLNTYFADPQKYVDNNVINSVYDETSKQYSRLDYSLFVQTVSSMHCVNSAFNKEENVFTFSVDVPNPAIIQKAMNTDSAFITSCRQLSIDDIAEKTKQYVLNIIQSESCPMITKEITLQSVDGQFVDDTEFVKLALEVVNYNYSIESAVISGSAASDNTQNDDTQIPVITINDKSTSFVVECGGGNALIGNVVLKKGEDAVNYLKNLSKANSSLAVDTTDTCYFIEYDVTNLSTNSVTITNGFILKDEKLLKNTGFFPVGLTESGTIEVGETISLSTFLVGHGSSVLLWYLPETSTCYELQ